MPQPQPQPQPQPAQVENLEPEDGFFVSEKGPVLVVSFVKSLTCKNPGTLDRCIEAIGKSAARAVVLNLQAVSVIERGQVPKFVNLQMVIRRKKIALGLCSLEPGLATTLTGIGVIRANEVWADLKQALMDLGIHLRRNSPPATPGG